MIKKEILFLIQEGLKKAFEENQNRPNQYVVAYFRKSDDTLIGYHASTFCQVTNELLSGKRYSGENPYGQLAIIAKNIKHTLDNEHKGMFAEISNNIRDNDFGGLKSDEIYLDAIYLADGSPKQDFRYHIIDCNEPN